MKCRDIFVIAILLIFPGSLLAYRTVDKKPQSRLDIKINRMLDLYYLLRKEAALNSISESNDARRIEAVSVTRQLQNDLGGPISPIWNLLDAALIKCKTASDVIKLFSELPVSTKFRGKEYAVREGALRLAKAMSNVDSQFLKSEWKQRDRMLKTAVLNIDKTIKPKEKEYFSYIAKKLDLIEPQKPLSIYFVTESPSPGAFTYFLRDGGILIVIDISNKGSLLYESVFHEVIHALEGMPSQNKINEPTVKKSVFAQLDERLQKAGVSERDRDFAGHLLVFAQAAEMVKHFLDPQHKPYGEAKTVYARLSFITPFVVPVWNNYLENKISREQALTQIVEGIVKKEKLSPLQ